MKMMLLEILALMATSARLVSPAVSGAEQQQQTADGHGMLQSPPHYADTQSSSGYNLPSGADLVVGNIRSTFSCDKRIYGYYADQDNNCQIFHVCNPVLLADGSQQTQMLSFFCNDKMVFDQQHLTCMDPSDALPCDQANTFYSVNENFGKIDQPQT